MKTKGKGALKKNVLPTVLSMTQCPFDETRKRGLDSGIRPSPFIEAKLIFDAQTAREIIILAGLKAKPR